jgi:hypothetical protein
MTQYNKTLSDFNISILEREFNILYSDLEESTYFGSTLKKEVHDFLDDLKYQRRNLNRSYANIKETTKVEEDENLMHLEEQISKLDDMESQINNIIGS